MKKRKQFSKSFSVVFAGLLLLFFFSCKKEVKIAVETTVPVLTTNATNITSTNADIEGKVTSNGGSDVTTQGICWGINENPTIAGNKISIGTSSEGFTIKMTGLTPGTTYYVRAYATSSAGTGYGNQKSFQTLSEIITDMDGNIYHSVTIGTQIWMVENLKTTKYRDGTPIPNLTDGNSWGTGSSGAYCWYNNDGSTNKNTYGALYNWYAINIGNLCPTGWHVPTTVEWTTLTDYLGGLAVAGGKMKQTGTIGWTDPNAGATNETGFTAVGGGVRNTTNGTFAQIGTNGYWWSATESTTTHSWRRGMGSSNAAVSVGENPKNYALSVRCMKDVVSDPGTSLDYRFDGSISLQVLQNYLSRAIHMGHLGEGVGSTVDNIRMVKNIGAKYLGRVVFVYGKESTFPQRLQTINTIGAQIHANDPDVILEGGVFEYVSTDVNTLPIPAYVFQQFNLPVETRNFRQSDMVFADNPIINRPYTVPDITKMETRLWYYYLATSQIDAGIESIHWGFFEPQAVNDKASGYTNYFDMFARVRLYAKTHARRHFVLCNADANVAPGNGGDLLFDFGSGNLHANGIQEVLTDPQKCILTGKYGSSGNGVTPSGWATTRLPFLSHFDNNGKSAGAGTPGDGSWHWDEISWFANQPESYRNEFLRYADNYISNIWPGNAGHLEMPGIRIITPAINGTSNYFANSSSLYPWGFNQEETIRQIWAGQ
ncbi:MAG: hypothetical protein M0Q53_06990 [Prolixibacteraceae bacterium]|jgi:uncharacterized protein (TIGR02145 family)|nr:hypothetical protein [Prolixibacteraceae bacterium]